MQIGINIANHQGLLSKRYIQDTARLAEDLGFDSVWIPDHAVVPRAVEACYGPVYYDARDADRQFMEGNTEQIAADLLELQALGAAHVVLSTQTNALARFRWEIETLAAHVLPQVH
jgi:alkanesulfonate monooxygenase SsuD/methylene tetrahydromethanopterin reductase-like flavin-dependent oxidoreductase (luciferase family)